MEDSNVLILLCKRKNKAQGKAKDGKKDKNKEDPKMSKSKLKKLQKLKEKRQKKLLQAKNIEILRKRKISDDAYSLLRIVVLKAWKSEEIDHVMPTDVQSWPWD